MDTKSLLIGIISFMAGGLLVSIAAVTFDKPQTESTSSQDYSMSMMENSLKNKTGDDFDKEFLTQMIVHHEGAVGMAKQAEQSAKHDEIKQLAASIITAQEKEISDMKSWQKMWDYNTATDNDDHMMH
jgi:uncharacterized protein (DUF305 family)